jgi:protein involved in polysaccharide export with SLBB domain
LKKIPILFLVFLAPSLAIAQISGQTGGFSGSGPAVISPGSLPPGITPEMAQQFLGKNPALIPVRPDAPPTSSSPAGDPVAKDSQAPALALTTPQARPGSFRFFVNQSLGRDIPAFGQAFFSRTNTFAALQSQPVPANYVVGPGDEILLKIYGGAVEFDQRATVDRSGMITLPKVGPVSVAGLAVNELEPALRRHLSRVLTDFNLFVSMGALRGIEIYVVGQAQAPGKYVVSSVSTLINALFATGGPSEQGTMRSIELVRENKVITRLDLYEFMTRGDKSKDVRLLPGDVINIPAAGPKVALVGSIPNEAIFEIHTAPKVTFLKEVVALAGGVPVVTSPLRASLERVEPGRNRPLVAATISLDDIGLNTPLKDGDILTLYPIKPAFENAVSLRVLDSPIERFPIAQGARVSDLIPSRESLLTKEFWQRRFQPEQSSEKVGTRIEAIRYLSRVDQINWEQATIERIRQDDLSTQVISFNLGRAILQKDPAHNVELKSGDVLNIFSHDSVLVPKAKQTRLVQVEGEINAPGIYQLQTGETLPELLARAGGLTPNAYVFGTSLSREAVREEQKKNLELVIRQLESQLSAASSELVNVASMGAERAALEALNQQNRQQIASQVARLRALTPNGRIAMEMEPSRQRLPDIPLEDGDVIRIPNPPGHVAAVGAVYNESVLIFRPGRTVLDYLKVAGISEQAERGGTFVVRADGSIVAPPPKGTFTITSEVAGPIANLELMPGDTIVVPEKFIRESGYSVFMRSVKDWTQILYQLGLGAAAIKVLR